jgi:hypothetical protein
VSRIQMVWLNLRRISSLTTPRDAPNLGVGAFAPGEAVGSKRAPDATIRTP